MQIIDYKAQLRKFYKPSGESVELVDVPQTEEGPEAPPGGGRVGGSGPS